VSADAERHSLAAFFTPRSVAVIGASRDPSKIGGSVLANLRAGGFPGRIVPVNERADTVQGLPAIPSVRAADGPIDLAVLTVPARCVLTALEDCEAIGVGGAIVISAGFRESGADGAERERALRDWLRGRRLRVLGPNCLGWIRPAQRLNATFAPGMPARGGIAFVSHSGALAVAILDWSRERRMGFSLFASLGNQADVTEADVLTAAAADDETRVIVAYVEGVADGRAFIAALGEAASRKPVVVLKAGRSAEGASAVASHTGALAGSDEAFDAVVQRAGAVRARTIEELFDLARGLAAQPLPRGRRLVVLTNGGGLGIVATDAARAAGLTMAPPPPDVRQALAGVLPPMASVRNPIDLIGDADAARYGGALHAVGDGRVADATLVLLTAQAATDAVGVARAIVGATREWATPIVAAFVGGARLAAGAGTLEEAGIPCYPFPERAVGVLAGMAVLAERRRERGPAPPPIDASRRERARQSLGRPGEGGVLLGLFELQAAFAAYGIPVAAARVARTPAEAAALAPEVGLPVALKLRSPDITHKTDVGGVQLALTSASAVAEAATAMLAHVRAARPDARLEGLLVQPMAAPGRELLVGAREDPQFGRLVVVGAGGVDVEVLRDVAARLAPVTPAEAATMVDELRIAPLLRGTRGRPPADLGALARVVAALSTLAIELPELTEIEINPLVVGPAGVLAVDARAVRAAPPAP
jgi:acetyltransferase